MRQRFIFTQFCMTSQQQVNSFLWRPVCCPLCLWNSSFHVLSTLQKIQAWNCNLEAAVTVVFWPTLAPTSKHASFHISHNATRCNTCISNINACLYHGTQVTAWWHHYDFIQFFFPQTVSKFPLKASVTVGLLTFFLLMRGIHIWF